MAEYIERKRAIVDACNSLELYPSEYAKLEDALNKIPAADVEPVRHGRWLPQIIAGEKTWHCSECETLGSPVWKRCPVCEAKMYMEV